MSIKPFADDQEKIPEEISCKLHVIGLAVSMATGIDISRVNVQYLQRFERYFRCQVRKNGVVVTLEILCKTSAFSFRSDAS